MAASIGRGYHAHTRAEQLYDARGDQVVPATQVGLLGATPSLPLSPDCPLNPRNKAACLLPQYCYPSFSASLLVVFSAVAQTCAKAARREHDSAHAHKRCHCRRCCSTRTTRSRPRSARQRVTLGPPPTPTSASAGGTPPKERDGERSRESERSNGRG